MGLAVEQRRGRGAGQQHRGRGEQRAVRLNLVAVWRETTVFTDAERAQAAAAS
jgi:hypothetical protein